MKKIEVVTTYTVKKYFEVEVPDNFDLENEVENLELYDNSKSEETDYWESNEVIDSYRVLPLEIKMDVDSWVKEYEPIQENGEEKTIMASTNTYAEMVEYAKSIADNPEEWKQHVWTSVDGDNGDIFIQNSVLIVNNIEWYFTKKPWSFDNLITVELDDIK